MWSYAQNFEDVILERLFKEVEQGFYVDIGAWDPSHLSVTAHFYKKGWNGINVEPIAERLECFQKYRSRDINISAAIATEEGFVNLCVCEKEEYLSTTNAQHAATLKERDVSTRLVRSRTLNSILEENAPEQISFLKIDVEGSEADVLASIDLSRWRPRVILLEATLPCGRPDWDHPENHGVWDKWEPDLLKAGYTFAHFDGLNRFYVRNEDQKLIPRFHLPPGVFDEIENFSPLPPSGLMPLKSSVPIVVKTEAKRRVPDTAKATRRLMKNAGKRIKAPSKRLGRQLRRHGKRATREAKSVSHYIFSGEMFRKSPGPEHTARRRLFALGLIGVCVISTATALAGLVSIRISATEASIAKSLQVRSTVNELLDELKDAETGQRGYLLTSNENFLEPFKSAERDIPAILTLLSQFSARAERQGTDLTSVGDIAALARAKLDELNKTVALSHSGRRDTALEMVAGGQGKELMDRLRADAGRFSDWAIEASAAEQSELDDLRHMLLYLIIASLGTTVVTLTFGLIYYTRTFAKTSLNQPQL